MKPDIKGLTKLATKLRQVPRKQFAMDSWWATSSCGTTGCIAGWAAVFFPSRFRKIDGYEWGGKIRYEVEHISSGFLGDEGFARGFRISLNDATDITVPWDHNKPAPRTPIKAAKNIMALVGRLRARLKK